MLALAIATGLAGCGKVQQTALSDKVTYSNPVLKNDCPDPTLFDNRARDGWFYMASTRSKGYDGIRRHLPVYRSKDLLNWEIVEDGFRGVKPAWSERGANWAPDLNFAGGKYIVYYAMGVWGDLIESASGVAVADAPAGPYTDMGMLVSYANTKVKNSIDPNYFEDKGRKYLYWGSLGNGSGIWACELSSDGLSLKEGSAPVLLSNTSSEAACMHKHKGKYYLFASMGSCCEGANSTYRVVVGRSDSPLGPFVSRSGKSMKDPDYDEVVLKGEDSKLFVGPGHNSEIVTDDAGQDWILYHVYWKGNGYNGRCLAMDKVGWDKKGWPVISDGKPSTTSEGPVFKH